MQAGDAGNIEQGGNPMEEGEKRGWRGVERWLRRRVEMGFKAVV